MLPFVVPSPESLAAVLVNAAGIYVAMILFTRLAGLRSFSKMSSFDFSMTVAVGSVIATAATTADMPLLLAVASLAMIYALQMGISWARRYDWASRLVDNDPLLLVRDGEILRENLERSDVSMNDLRAKLREANALQIDEVEAVVFETTGDVSVLHSDDPEARVDDWLLENVRNPERDDAPEASG